MKSWHLENQFVANFSLSVLMEEIGLIKQCLLLIIIFNSVVFINNIRKQINFALMPSIIKVIQLTFLEIGRQKTIQWRFLKSILIQINFLCL